MGRWWRISGALQAVHMWPQGDDSERLSAEEAKVFSIQELEARCRFSLDSSHQSAEMCGPHVPVAALRLWTLSVRDSHFRNKPLLGCEAWFSRKTCQKESRRQSFICICVKQQHQTRSITVPAGCC